MMRDVLRFCAIKSKGFVATCVISLTEKQKEKIAKKTKAALDYLH